MRNALRVSAFSLIELIGVLSVVAIIAALAVPSVIRQIDHAANVREAADLQALSDGLMHQIVANKSIPARADMPQTIASWIRQPVSKVSKNPRGYNRAFVVDLDGWTASLQTAAWTQTSGGLAANPEQARLMIISSLSREIPSIEKGDFLNVWNTPDGQNPPAWLGRAEDLHIQRISLDPLFHHLALVNRDPPGNARYAIDSTNSVPLTNVLSRFFLNGTDLGLYDGSASPSVQMRVLLDQDKSFVFQGGKWAGQLESGDEYTDLIANQFANLAGEFLQMELVDTAHKGGNQQGAVISMFDFMLTFQLWANQCPHFQSSLYANRNDVPEYILLYKIAGDLSSSTLLNSFTGTDGLLK